jgi:hypothetical protein
VEFEPLANDFKIGALFGRRVYAGFMMVLLSGMQSAAERKLIIRAIVSISANS